MSGNPRDPAWAPSPGVPRTNQGGGTIPGRSQPRQFRSAALRAGLLRLALKATVVLAAAQAAFLLALSIFFEQAKDLSGGPLAGPVLQSSVLPLLTAGLAAITFLLWLAWSSRVEANAPTIGAGEGTIGPSGAILWWFVPIANLLVPFGLVLGLGRRLSDEDHPPRDGLVVVWWLTLLASGVAVVATWIALRGAVGDAAVRAALVNAALAQLAWALAAAFSLLIVRYIQSRENSRAARVPSWAGSGPNVLARVASVGGTMVGLPGAVRVRPAATPGFPSVPSVKAPPRPTRGSPATARSRTRSARRRSGGWTWAIVALFIVGFLVLPQLIDALQGGAPSPPTTRPRPIPTRSPRPTVSAVPVSTPAPSATEAAGWAAPETSQPSATEIPPPASPPSASEIPPPASPPSASSAPAYLLGHASEGDGTCAATPTPSVPSGALAAIDCHPASTAVLSLQYAAFSSSDAARSSYDVAVAASGIGSGTGACFLGQQGETSFLTNERAAGRVLCFIDDAGGGAVPRIVWVDERLAILGHAKGSGATLGDLFDWWKAQSGPI